ncbi:hypothetical protein CYMTET_10386 [Cymbomonas tetramitiformis]|uniref:Uncharacterized protein n=1 Tax=Cymbomonas tetramitiformis TaxID=36881 RepID=A0AAE0GPI6_9CHLO|nr:hypothetical protein CYMTET_10386 [Cymbomonas tetramitiformis]
MTALVEGRGWIWQATDLISVSSMISSPVVEQPGTPVTSREYGPSPPALLLEESCQARGTTPTTRQACSSGGAMTITSCSDPSPVSMHPSAFEANQSSADTVRLGAAARQLFDGGSCPSFMGALEDARGGEDGCEECPEEFPTVQVDLVLSQECPDHIDVKLFIDIDLFML